MNKPTVAAFIPARAGSKRIKNKNIRRLAKHPMIAYTIAQALQSKIFDRVIVSTNSKEIANIARYYGAEVPFLRPEEYATDTSPDIEWLHYTLNRLRNEGDAWDAFTLLRPTSPFRKPETIQRAWAQFTAAGEAIDSLRAVEKVQQHPGKMWKIIGDRMTPLLLQPKGVPWHSSQYPSLPVVYVQNASLEIGWSRIVLEDQSLAGNVIIPFITNDAEGYDINIPYDWQVAEIMLANGDVTLTQISQAPYPED